ncbi:MAG TPA: NADH-quinone oxidoreductase subunit A [Candidatus Thermoplasmatota archaeon]|nr:NADH-quinone oxidoreductase subunit A [Candidatus Thermoplasmatota archaeon]
MADVLFSYLPVAVLLVLAVAIVFVTLNVGKVLGRPYRPGALKKSTYECGEVPFGSARSQVDIQYYLYVLLFLVIDVEIAFLVIFATTFATLAFWEIVAMVLFTVLILDGWLYAWKKGALEWAR